MVGLAFGAPSRGETKRDASRAYDELDGGDRSAPRPAPTTQKNTQQSVAPAASAQRMAAQSNSSYAGDFPMPTIITVPAQKTKGMSDLQAFLSNPNHRMATEAINSYLTQRQYEVKSLQGTCDNGYSMHA